MQTMFALVDRDDEDASPALCDLLCALMVGNCARVDRPGVLSPGGGVGNS